MIKGHNFINGSKTIAINTIGEILNVGDLVKHQDETAGVATIQSFEFSNNHEPEILAKTDKGSAHIDFISKLSTV